MQNNMNGTFHLLLPDSILLASTLSWDCIADNAMGMQLMFDSWILIPLFLCFMISNMPNFTTAGELVGAMLPNKVFDDGNKTMIKEWC